VKITDVADAASQQAKILRSQVDVLILISHNNVEVNTELARIVPGLDVVISGHSHKKLYQPIVVQNAGRSVPVVETGEWGKFLGDLTLELDPKQKTIRVKKYELHPVSSDIAEDPRMISWIDEQDRILSARYGRNVHEVLAQSEFTMHREDHHESPIGNLAARAYRVATGADLALEEISLTGFAIPQGDVTYMDLHDVVPHIYNPDTGKEWELHLWDAQGSDLASNFKTRIILFIYLK
jgi:2',3'-cyclic-nucleotide 2'-phosphodiesterase (5'-nucleotidase family)